MIPWLWATAAVLINGALAVIQPSSLQPVKQWNLVTYNFEWNAPVNDKNFYNPENIVSTGIAFSYDKIFLATPRLFSGVSATLSTVSLTSYEDSPVLEAYPDWSFHTVSLNNYNCSDLGLISVYRLRVDSCNRLWALDAGVSRSLEDYEITCPPKILVFDLSTNQVVRRIDFPREVRRGESLFTNLVVDETTSKPGGNCDDVFVYISDTVEPAIVVYDSARDLTWRLTHPAMYPDPDFAQSEIEGNRFVLMDGIVGITFDEKSGIVYFQPLATDRLFSITKQVLRAGPVPVNQVLPVKLVGKKSSQGIGLAVTNDGSIFFSPFTETALASWNPQTNLQNVIAYDPENLQFVADMTLSKYDPAGLYLLSSKFHRFFLKNLNSNEVNTRIMRIDLSGGSPTSYHPFPLKSSFPPTQPLHSQVILQKTPDYSTQYFNSIRQPYQFEPVGLINRKVNSPFTALNAGEKFPQKLPVSYLGGDPLYSNARADYGSFNTLRVAKSIVNLNITHH